MSTVATKLRTAKRAASPKPDTPDTALAEITALFEHALALVEGGQSASGDQGDMGCRLLYAAEDTIRKILANAVPTRETMMGALNQLYDAQAFLQGCAAMHVGDARGMLAAEADKILDGLCDQIDRPQFWLESPAKGADSVTTAPEAAPAGDPHEVHQAGPLVIERNEPGQLHFESRDELRKFAVTNAHVLSCLNVCLHEVIDSEVDGGFVRVFAQHVSDLAWVQETATGLLLGGAEQ